MTDGPARRGWIGVVSGDADPDPSFRRTFPTSGHKQIDALIATWGEHLLQLFGRTATIFLHRLSRLSEAIFEAWIDQRNIDEQGIVRRTPPGTSAGSKRADQPASGDRVAHPAGLIPVARPDIVAAVARAGRHNPLLGIGIGTGVGTCAQRLCGPPGETPVNSFYPNHFRRSTHAASV